MKPDVKNKKVKFWKYRYYFPNGYTDNAWLPKSNPWNKISATSFEEALGEIIGTWRSAWVERTYETVPIGNNILLIIDNCSVAWIRENKVFIEIAEF